MQCGQQDVDLPEMFFALGNYIFYINSYKNLDTDISRVDTYILTA